MVSIKGVLTNPKLQIIVDCTQSFAAIAIGWLLLLTIFRVLEILIIGNAQLSSFNFFDLAGWSLWIDFIFWLTYLLPLFIIYTLFYLISVRWAKVILLLILVIFFLVHAGLSLYFSTSLSLAGADIFSYSKNDVVQTVGASGDLNAVSIAAMILLIALTVFALQFIGSRLKTGKYFSSGILGASLLFIVFGSSKMVETIRFKSNFENQLAINKSAYFYKASYKYFFPAAIETDIYAESYIGDYGSDSNAVQFEYVDESQYPFLHEEVAADVLSPFFSPKRSAPNIVIILMEGLGRAYSNDGAYLGSFTPFLDSLASKSLYWENFLSQGGRTFAVLPSILGSLPFAKNGFLELGANMPAQLSLLNLLQANDYQASFYYGGNGSFDNMNLYFEKNGVKKIMDQKSFPLSYIKIPPVNGFTWGFSDKELYRHYLSTVPVSESNNPILSVLMTMSAHNPFIINEPVKYLKIFEDKLTELRLNDLSKSNYRNYQNQYLSIMYADDAVRNFITEYSKRADYDNTIFIITGDHRIPEIPMRTKIDRYHVPLIIYSPLLKRTARFSSISTHFDLTPSILSYLKTNHNVRIPFLISWIGGGARYHQKFPKPAFRSIYPK